MTFFTLPPEMIAHIAQFLDFPSISQFAQSNRRINNAITYYKAYKKDIFQLKLEFNRDKVAQGNVVEVSGQYFRGKPFSLNNIVDEEGHHGILFILQKFRSINWLDISGTPLNVSICKTLMECPAKIELLVVARSVIQFPIDILLKLFSKFRKIRLFGCWIPTELLTDRIICHILAKTELCLHSCVVPPHPFTCALTDSVLEAIGENEIQKEFCINNWKNNFTVKRINELVEKVISSESFDIWWDFGILRLDQFWPACNFAAKINNDKSSPYFVMQHQRNGSEFLIQLKAELLSRRRLHVVFQVEDALF